MRAHDPLIHGQICKWILMRRTRGLGACFVRRASMKEVIQSLSTSMELASSDEASPPSEDE